MQVKKTIKVDARLKEAYVLDGVIVNSETGEAVDLVNLLAQVYGNTPFSLVASSKTEDASEVGVTAEEFDLSQVDEDGNYRVEAAQSEDEEE